MKVRVILNGKKAGLDAVRSSIFRARNTFSCELEVRLTWEAGDVHRLVNEAVAEGVSRIIIAGGDGTVNEVIDAVAQLSPADRPELAVLPLGTANDFATGCQIPSDAFDALELAIMGEVKNVDIVRANDRHFINVASGGFGAEVTVDTPVELKNFIGGGAYTLAGLVKSINFKPYRGVLTSETMQLSGDMIIGAICNGRQAGGGQQLAPGAFINDGLLDVFVLLDFPLSAVNQVIAEISGQTSDGKYVKRFQSPWLEYVSEKPGPLNLDGEPYFHEHIRFDVQPNALKFVLPDNCPCLKE